MSPLSHVCRGRFASRFAPPLLALGIAGAWAAPIRPDLPGLESIASSAICAVEVFSATEAVSTGYFEYQRDPDPPLYISTARLPFESHFAGEPGAGGWFLTGNVGLFHAGQVVETPASGRLGRYDITSLTAGLGLGYDLRLTDWLTLTPRLPVGYAYLEFRFEREILPGDPLAGLIPDWSSHAVSVFPSLELRPEWRTGSWRYGATSRYTVLYAREIRSVNEVRDFADANISSAIWRNGLFAAYDTPLRVSGLPVRLHAGCARNDLYGDITGGDFTNYFYEFNVGVGLLAPARWDPVTEVGLTFTTYVGPHFTGASFGLLLEF